jgi:transcription initiation factor TFIIIB Brf1 subunit/transcription initiation factor TFIIB
MVVVDDDDDNDNVTRNPQERDLFSPNQAGERSRVGRPNMLPLHDKGLAIAIGTIAKDAGGMGLDIAMHLLMGRLRTCDSRIQVSVFNIRYKEITRVYRLILLSLD